MLDMLLCRNSKTKLILKDLTKSIYLPRVGKIDSPIPGSVIFCNIFGGNAEHTGIFIGENQIVQLSGKGIVEKVTPEQFVARKGNILPYYDIYVSCRNGVAVGSVKAAERAKILVGKRRNYNLFLDNCHQFTAGCLTGNFENPINFFLFLESEVRKVLNINNWRTWERGNNVKEL